MATTGLRGAAQHNTEGIRAQLRETHSQPKPSLHQSRCVTLIYSSNPKISRCYQHSDILHFFLASLIFAYFFPPGKKKKEKERKEERKALESYTIDANRWFGRPFGSRLVLLRARRCEWGLLDRVLRANPNGASTVSSGGLSKPYCASSPSPFYFVSFPPRQRKHGNSRSGQPVR